jgi:hypothetical protein
MGRKGGRERGVVLDLGSCGRVCFAWETLCFDGLQYLVDSSGYNCREEHFVFQTEQCLRVRFGKARLCCVLKFQVLSPFYAIL